MKEKFYVSAYFDDVDGVNEYELRMPMGVFYVITESTIEAFCAVLDLCSLLSLDTNTKMDKMNKIFPDYMFEGERVSSDGRTLERIWVDWK